MAFVTLASYWKENKWWSPRKFQSTQANLRKINHMPTTVTMSGMVKLWNLEKAGLSLVNFAFEVSILALVT